MKYTVKYSCGHTGTVELFGKESERERKIAWYERAGMCPECYATARKAEQEKAAAEYSLPELVGTEKQVAWAEKIRMKFIELREEQAKRNAELYARTQDTEANIEKHKALFVSFCAEFFGETSASAWIARNEDSENAFKFSQEFKAFCKSHIND